MSEKVYAWLLRLYPGHFREEFGEEALQLFRDRAHEERGLVPRMRLWCDLLADLAISLPREYGRPKPADTPAVAERRWDGVPSFRILDGESPRPGALLPAPLLSLVLMLSAFAVPQPPVPRRGAPGIPGAMVPAPSQAAILDARERQHVVDAAIVNLQRYYIDQAVGEKTAAALLKHLKNGDYDAISDGAALADLLNKQMRAGAHDGHLRIAYHVVKTPERPPGPPPPDALARYRKEMESNNCTFEKVEVLPHNIGYLKLNAFPYPPVCQPTLAASMAALNHADAIIFDVRDNGGGSGSMVELIAGYLFDQPAHLHDLYNRAANTREQSWTVSPVPGNRLADKPVYVLTSARTFSAAEAFSYDLKMLKRATLVGETTAGGAHVAAVHWIDDHFGMMVADAMPINPISKTNWEGTGVQPDVKVKAADALKTARKLAERRLVLAKRLHRIDARGASRRQP